MTLSGSSDGLNSGQSTLDKRFVTLTSGTNFSTRTQSVPETILQGHESGSVPFLERLSKVI